jgi:serpin B
MLNSRKDAIVRASLPKFEYDYELDMIDVLKTMGIVDAFSVSNADFTKLGTAYDDIYISKVKHKTHIKVDQSGTRAAAVTFVGFSCGCVAQVKKTYTVKLDRPFVYCIVDNETNLPVFIGVVTNLG